jgi:hypothetical protein
MQGTPENRTMNGKILYASYQEEESLPHYIRYALSGLTQTGFSVVYLTNQRDLDAESHAFLDKNKIELFFTENKGYDFGMWHRYLKYVAKFRRESWDRLVLINDSIVYYQNRFKTIFERCEKSSADVVSLTSDTQIHFHLQSFFLYLKPKALPVLFDHLLESNECMNFYEVVKRMEIGLSQKWMDAELTLEALYKTERPVLFSYQELILGHAGFIKRKLLQKRFTREEVFHFWEHGAASAFNQNYYQLIEQEGAMDSDFRKEWLVTTKESMGTQIQKAFRLIYYHIYWKLKQIKLDHCKRKITQ